MADNTKIEWTDATWNPVNGCSLASPGCTNCYAMKQAHRVPQRRGLTQHTSGGMVWTGEVRFDEAKLTQPLHWKRPRKIFVCAHGDLFHDAVPDEWIDRVFAVMALWPQHTFQVLTKRSARMRAWMRDFIAGRRYVGKAIRELADVSVGRVADYIAPINQIEPLPNAWLGVSVEDQARRNRIVDLAQTPAARRYISGEPLLTGLSLTDIPLNGGPDQHGIQWLFNALSGEQYFIGDDGLNYSGDGPVMEPLDCVIVGGESGPGARPMHPDWARTLRDQCAAAGVPFFFKQWGDWAQHPSGAPVTIRQYNDQIRYIDVTTGQQKRNVTRNSDETMRRIGKRSAGRLLDGIEHNAMPGGAA